MRLLKLFSFIVTGAFFVFGHYALLAQPFGVNKDYYFEERSTIFHAVRVFDDDVVVLGQSGIDSSGLSSILVMRVDTFGQIEKLDFYKDPTLSDHTLLSHFSCDAIAYTSDDGLLVAGAMLVSDNLFLIKLNSSLDLEYFIEYESDFLVRWVTDLLKLYDHYYIISLIQKQDKDLDIAVQKIDSLGNKIWEKTFGNPFYRDDGSSAVVANGKIVVADGEYFDPNQFVFNDESNWRKFLYIDTSGNLEYEWKSDLNEEEGSASSLLYYDDKYFYTVRPGYQENIQLIHFGNQIVCRDTMHNLIWHKDYSEWYAYQNFGDMVLGDDGYLYVTGQIYDEVMWARIFKIDPLNGDVIWQARDTGLWRENWGSRNVMEGIAVLPSGSVVAVGFTWAGQGFERGFLLKTTKDGCIDTICTTSTIVEYLARQLSQVIVYPNPTTDHLIFEIDEDIRDDIYAETYDLTGKKIQSQSMRAGINVMMLDEGSYSPGMYLWRAVTEKGVLIEAGKFVVMRE